MACSCPIFSSVDSSSSKTRCGTFGCSGDSGRQVKESYTSTFCKNWFTGNKKLVTCNVTKVGCCG